MRPAPADLLRSIYAAAVAGAQPRAATERAVAALLRRHKAGDVWVIALGKAAHAMAAGALEALATSRRDPAGGIVVGADDRPPPHPAIDVVAGDHPVPGARSLAAAERLGATVARVDGRDTALVLLSGGASSLAGAPIDEIAPEELSALHELLLASGADVATINAVRKRFSRWGAGRLAAALAPARVHCLVVSDVVGDDLAAIGSGPCVADPTTAPALVAWLHEGGLWDALPRSLAAQLEAVARGDRPETPKAGDPVLRRVTTRIILGNRHALRAAAGHAAAIGLPALGVRTSMRGDAARRGEAIAAQLAAARSALRVRMPPGARRGCFLWGGETTVSLAGAAHDARGGRCQELALSAARALYALGEDGVGITLLAAGTDGRDGPTDAAGAIVDNATWQRVRAAGRDPARDLAGHDSYRALDAAGALLRTGLTGTNVTDVVIGLARAE